MKTFSDTDLLRLGWRTNGNGLYFNSGRMARLDGERRNLFVYKYVGVFDHRNIDKATKV